MHNIDQYIKTPAHKAGADFMRQCGYDPFLADTRWDDKAKKEYSIVYFRRESTDRVFMSRMLPDGSTERLPDVLKKAAVGLAKKRGKKKKAEVLGQEPDAE